MDYDNILGVRITRSSEKEILKYITTRLLDNEKKWYIVTPNPEMVVLAKRDFEFKLILNRAEVSLPDGMGLVWSSRLLKKGIKKRITGVDMVYKICRMLSDRGLTAGFLGGEKGVAEDVAKCLTKIYPKLKVVFAGAEWSGSVGNSSSLASELTLANSSGSNIHLSRSIKLPSAGKINQTQSASRRIEPLKSIDFLFVAFGFPKQEKWIYENLDMLPVKCVMGVGGAFDYISGRVPRAPIFIRNLGFEWLYRLIVQPWRIKRQAALVDFGWLVLKETFNLRLKRSVISV